MVRFWHLCSRCVCSIRYLLWHPIKEKELFSCDKCDFSSTNKNNYLTHKLNNHSTKEERKQQFKYYCDTCDVGVFSETSFNNHKETIRHKRFNK